MKWFILLVLAVSSFASGQSASRPSTRPTKATRTVDGVPFGDVAFPVTKTAPRAHSRVGDAAKLLLCPPGESGVKLFSISKSNAIFRRRLPSGIIPPGDFQFFATDVGGADIAMFSVDAGVISQILLAWRSPSAAQRMLIASYPDKKIDPWRSDALYAGQMMQRPGDPIFATATASAKEEIDKWRKQEKEQIAASESDPIKRAILTGSLAIGMTLEQANAAMASRSPRLEGRLESETDNSKVYRWSVGGYVSLSAKHGKFVNGKLDEHWGD